MPTKPKIVSSSEDAPAKYRAPALEKGLDILELMARHSYPIKASQMAETLGRSLSELFRMIQVLEFRGFIRLADNKEGYVLTNKLFALGMSQPPTQSLMESALPVMNRLAEQTGQSCHLVVPSDDQSVVIARVESPADIGFAVRVGYRRNILDTTSGPVLFALLPDEEKKAWLDMLKKSDGHRPIKTFQRMAGEVRKKGYAIAKSDFVEGVTDLCAPIIGNHGPVAALTIPFVYRKPLICPLEKAVEHLLEASENVTTNLHGGI